MRPGVPLGFALTSVGLIPEGALDEMLEHISSLLPRRSNEETQWPMQPREQQTSVLPVSP